MATIGPPRLRQATLWLLVVAACITLFPTSRAEAQEVTVSLTADPPTVLVGEPITFTFAVDPPVEAVEYVIDFGDGNVGRSETPELVHVYEQPGGFAAFPQLEQGREVIAEGPPVEVVVNEPEPSEFVDPSFDPSFVPGGEAAPPNVNLIADPPVVLAGAPITFTVVVDSLFEPVEYVIDFGDGNVGRSEGPELVYVYEQPGAFVAFPVLEQNGEVFAEGPPVEVAVNEPEPSEFVDPSLDPSLGLGGEEAPLNVSLTADRNVLTAGEIITFTATVDSLVGAVEYVFNFTDRPAPEISANPTFSRPYEESGVFEAAVQLMQEGEVFAESLPVTITVAPDETAGPLPAITIRAEPPDARSEDPVVFSAVGGSDEPGVEYRFHFGDGQTSDWSPAREVTHTYAAPGSYNASVEMRGLPNTAQAIPSTPILMTVAAPPGAAASPGPTTQPGSLPLPFPWVLLVGVLLILAVGGFILRGKKKRRARKPAPRPERVAKPKPEPEKKLVPGSELVVKPKTDPGTPQVVGDQPFKVQMEMRLRPIKDPGQHHLEAGADLLIQERRNHGG